MRHLLPIFAQRTETARRSLAIAEGRVKRLLDLQDELRGRADRELSQSGDADRTLMAAGARYYAASQAAIAELETALTLARDHAADRREAMLETWMAERRVEKVIERTEKRQRQKALRREREAFSEMRAQGSSSESQYR